MKTMLARLIKHLGTTAAAGRKMFPAATLKAIESAIAEGEQQHRAEIRVIIEPALSPREVLQHTSSRQRALDLFAAHRIWDTEENCGVLIYINLADHKVEIVTDRGIGRLLDAQVWQRLCQAMTQGFAKGAFHDSTLAALADMNTLLQQHLPANGATRSNQLPDRPLMI
jgi:uncharacterized membrane protein